MFIYIILGFIQGITEPIPVSSSGHLLIFKNLFNSDINYELLTCMSNFGSLIAILIIFKKEILSLLKNFFTKKNYIDYKYSWLIIIGTIPAVLIGFLISNLNVFNYLENNIKCVGITLIITSIFLFLVKDYNGYKNKENITILDSIIIGLFQAIALIPGISRSGSTIVGGLYRKLDRESAFNYSFMLYIPISIAAFILEIKNLFIINISINKLMLYLISMIISFIFTYISTHIFKIIVKNGRLIYFVCYCFIVGIIILFI